MRHLALILFLIFSVLCPQAQTDEAYSWSDKGVWAESPKAATIREVTTPLPALLTGAAEFSVPLHTLVAEDFALPFQFRYHATGIKRRQTDYGAVRGQIAKTADRRYMESFTFNADTLERIEFNGGYFDGQGKAHFLFTDWQGNVTMTTDAGGRLEQHIGYYPYGEPWREPAGQHAKLFAGKERVTGLLGGDYDFGPRGYRATTTLWDSPDRLAHKSPGISPWLYCAGNPIRYTDFSGNDTISVNYEEDGTWSRPNVKTATGDDVINVTKDNVTSTYIYSEGEYGKRVIALNLEIEGDYALGIYHVSGSAEDGTGYYVVPGGDASNENGSNARILDGVYPITAPTASSKWRKPGLGGDVLSRGIRFHYGNVKPRLSSEGCFVLFYNYEKRDGIVYTTDVNKREASENFDRLLGAKPPELYYIPNRDKPRYGSLYDKPIDFKFILRSL